MLKLVAVVLVALLVTVVGGQSSAQAKYASLVIEAESGRVLHSVNADTRNYPASLTKMMTLYLVFEALENGEITLKTRWKASRRAAGQPPSRIGLRNGDAISVEEAILALVTKSANDVATLVAENMAGSERDFALEMTAKARELGMNRTTFRNASGLPNRGQLSTARDMATLALALMRDYPDYYHYFSTRSFRYAGRSYRNHNALLKSYDGTDGIKTGYIRASGFNLVASVKRNGRRLVGVVFGGNSSRERNRHMIDLLDKGFRLANQGSTVVASNDGTVSGGKDDEVRVASNAASGAATKVSSGGDGLLSGERAWGIQVGAFADYGQAERMAGRAAELLPIIMRTADVAVVPLDRKSGDRLYRARIHGVSKWQAYEACRAIRKRNMACMELRLRASDLQVASVGDR